MWTPLKCKRAATVQDAVGTTRKELTEVWTAILNITPSDAATVAADSTRSREFDTDIVKRQLIFTQNTALDVRERDLLYVLKNNVETGVIHRVINVGRYKTVLALTIESESE